jgi:hypothetical protein
MDSIEDLREKWVRDQKEKGVDGGKQKIIKKRAK